MSKQRVRRGSVLLEFTLCAIPLIFVVVGIAQLAMGMWDYHCLAEAVSYTARMSASKGEGCAGKSCASTVAQTAQMLASRAPGLTTGAINATLASDASTVNCNPLSSCYSNNAAWPSLSGNKAGTAEVTITATYVFRSPVPMFAPKSGASMFGASTLGARSRQLVVY